MEKILSAILKELSHAHFAFSCTPEELPENVDGETNEDKKRLKLASQHVDKAGSELAGVLSQVSLVSGLMGAIGQAAGGAVEVPGIPGMKFLEIDLSGGEGCGDPNCKRCSARKAKKEAEEKDETGDEAA
jgi:hypothetical protein